MLERVFTGFHEVSGGRGVTCGMREFQRVFGCISVSFSVFSANFRCITGSFKGVFGREPPKPGVYPGALQGV